MQEIEFITTVHKSTQRDYIGRVSEADKAACAEIAIKWGKDYWDGDRKHGYGGYRYDGRWRVVAEAIAKHYGLKDDARILDVGCSKGFLLYEFLQIPTELRRGGRCRYFRVRDRECQRRSPAQFTKSRRPRVFRSKTIVSISFIRSQPFTIFSFQI